MMCYGYDSSAIRFTAIHLGGTVVASTYLRHSLETLKIRPVGPVQDHAKAFARGNLFPLVLLPLRDGMMDVT